MTPPSGAQAASALKWRAAEQIAIKLLFIVRTPVLARLLSPDDFGLLAIGLVSLDILLRLTNVGMVPALVQKEDVERTHYSVAWSVGIVRSLTVGVAVFFAAPYIAATFGEVRATPIIQFLALRPLLQSLASIGVADLTRSLNFRSLAILRLSDMGLDAIVSIGLAPFIGVWALVAGAITGPFVYVVLSYIIAPYRPRFTLDRSAAASLIRFGQWIFLSGIIGLAGRFLLQAIISRQLGTAELGLYYLAGKIAYTTTEVSAELIGTVAFPWFSRLQHDREEAEKMFRAMLRGMAIILIPICAMLIALAPSIVEDLLGPRWLGAEHVIQVMVVASLIGAYGDAVAPILRGLGQPHRVTLLDAIQTALLAALAWEAASRFGLVGAAGAWIPATAVNQVVAYVMLRGIFEAPLRGVPKTVVIVGVVSLVGSGLAFGTDMLVGGLFGLLLACAVGGIALLVLLLAADRAWSMDVVQSVQAFSPKLSEALERVADTVLGDRR